MLAVKPVRARMLGFRRIDALIVQHSVDEQGNALDGEAELLEHILARVMEGESLESIAGRYDVAYGAMWRWISGDKYRMAEYESALRGHADKLVHETKKIADDSDDAKLRIDARKWLSGKWDGDRFGEKSKVQIMGGISITEALAGDALSLLDRLRTVHVQELDAVSVQAMESLEDKLDEVVGEDVDVPERVEIKSVESGEASEGDLLI